MSEVKTEEKVKREFVVSGQSRCGYGGKYGFGDTLQEALENARFSVTSTPKVIAVEADEGSTISDMNGSIYGKNLKNLGELNIFRFVSLFDILDEASNLIRVLFYTDDDYKEMNEHFDEKVKKDEVYQCLDLLYGVADLLYEYKANHEDKYNGVLKRVWNLTDEGVKQVTS